jgi:hypothetical protein
MRYTNRGKFFPNFGEIILCYMLKHMLEIFEILSMKRASVRLRTTSTPNHLVPDTSLRAKSVVSLIPISYYSPVR